MAKKALGKGLGAIISNSAKPVEELENEIQEDAGGRIVELNVDEIDTNPDQPRTHFDEHEIKGLAESIKSVGLIQPIIVRKLKNRYTLVAGERRLRASKFSGLKKIKAIVIEADEVQNITLALIENIQRSDLDPIEEAKAYKVLVSRFKLKHVDIAAKVGKDRATITNSLRLLNLPEEIQEAISGGHLTSGHAKVLLSLKGQNQMKIFKESVARSLSVRALEDLVNTKKNSGQSEEKKSSKDAHVRKMEDELISVLGTKVEIRHSGSKGKIEISYYSLDDFERIIDIIK